MQIGNNFNTSFKGTFLVNLNELQKKSLTNSTLAGNKQTFLYSGNKAFVFKEEDYLKKNEAMSNLNKAGIKTLYTSKELSSSQFKKLSDLANELKLLKN